ncbi:hypothetical protein [Paenimyroides ceti]
MAKNKLSEMSTDELKKQKGLLRGIVIGMAVVMLLCYIVLIYLVLQNKKYVLLVIIPATFMSLLPSALRLIQINTELKARHSNK